MALIFLIKSVFIEHIMLDTVLIALYTLNHLLFFFFFLRWSLILRPDWPGIHYVIRVGLEMMTILLTQPFKY